MNLKVTLFLLTIFFVSCSSQKKLISIDNSKLNILRNCENTHPRACLKNNVSEIIMDEANRRGILLQDDRFYIFIRIKTDSTVSILRVKSSNDALYDVCIDVLSNLPPIKPYYSKEDKKHADVTPFWYAFIKNNKIIEVDLSQETRMDLF